MIDIFALFQKPDMVEEEDELGKESDYRRRWNAIGFLVSGPSSFHVVLQP